MHRHDNSEGGDRSHDRRLRIRPYSSGAGFFAGAFFAAGSWKTSASMASYPSFCGSPCSPPEIAYSSSGESTSGRGELVGAPSLVSLLADNRTRVNALLHGIPLLARNIEHSNQQHEAIVVAILTGNPEGAEAAMGEHLDGTAALLRAFLG